jgi:carbonic anhydrase/acetyltransferase-like protein (isoleucine patch superfamily)
MALYELGEERVAAAEAFWVAPNATVIGKVRIGEEASIWFNAVVRGDTEPIVIGARSNVQDGCVLHTDPGLPLTIGADCTIGHMAMLHGCTIGRGSLIGIGAVVLNGAQIGEECLVGARTLVSEGKVIPARSVVLGSPGRVVRAVSEQDLAMLRAAAAIYVEKWRTYARELRLQS